jgi:8-oxo-dGTP diphosphatase
MTAAQESPQLIAIAVVERGGQYLIRQRPEGAPLATFWEFPGGKVLPGESAEAAAVRECAEETGLNVRVAELMVEVDHQYDFGTLRLSFFRCEPINNAPLPSGGFCWVEGDSLLRYRFPAANEKVLALLNARIAAFGA